MDGLYIMENPIKMDDLGVPLFFFGNTQFNFEVSGACLALIVSGITVSRVFSRKKMLRGFGGSHWSGTRQVLACFSWVSLTFELCNVVVM